MDRKEKSDSCHIPSDKGVRYAGGEVKLQDASVAVQKMELCVSNRDANSFICNSYTRCTMVEKKPSKGFKRINMRGNRSRQKRFTVCVRACVCRVK